MRKRSKYKPRAVCTNPIAFAIEGASVTDTFRLDKLRLVELSAIDDLAKAAADRLEPHYSANPYLAGTVNHIRFATSYAARNVELQLELAPT